MKKFTISILMILLSSMFILFQGLNAQNILVVDRDGSSYGPDVYTDCWPRFQAALDENGYTYTYFEVMEAEDPGPDATTMGEHDLVVWFTGETWTDGQTMHIDDEFNLLLYLTMSEGKLFLSAQDYLWDIYPTYGTFSPGEFPYDELGVISVTQDVWHIEHDPDTVGNVVGAPGSLAEGFEFLVRDIFTTDAEDGLYIDSIGEHNGQDLFCMTLPEPQGCAAAIQYETDLFRVVFSTVSFAAITDSDIRTDLMAAIVNWLLYGSSGTSDKFVKDTPCLIVHPNPARDYVNIGSPDNINELWIVNSTGQEIFYESVDNIQTRVSTSSFKPGMYIVRAKTNKGMVSNRLMIQ
jgi:hypothetical protein